MGNYISTEPDSLADKASSMMHHVCVTYCIPCCISVPDDNVQAKEKYQNYTDEIAVSPKNQGGINLKLAYHSCTSENTPNYSYENLKKIIKVLKVIDGDTLDIALYYDATGKIFKHRVRLYGIDTPEMHPALSNPERLKEIGEAKLARDALVQRLEENDNLLVAHFHKFDKYGRLMATLYDKQGDDINKWMIASGYAQEYFGKTKKKFVERPPLMVSEQEYFETPRNSEQSEDKNEKPAEVKEDDFEEFPDDITEEAKNSIRIV
jgi:endonuclease YncB( thermonuclease family)